MEKTPKNYSILKNVSSKYLILFKKCTPNVPPPKKKDSKLMLGLT